jgi:prepilin-type N-terminal cleavage/methylation domain-containing protein/prepilin-type processing-associated H-X9-DG protein
MIFGRIQGQSSAEGHQHPDFSAVLHPFLQRPPAYSLTVATPRKQEAMNRHRQDGFTLIELLVVIALLVLLAAFLFPVFSQAREKGRQAGCVGNLKQIAAAMLLYCDEYDGLFPPALGRDKDEPVRFPMTWMARLQPFIKCSTAFIDRSSDHTNADWQASGDLMKNYGFPPSRRVAGQEALILRTGTGTAEWEGLGGYYGPPMGDFQQAAPSWSEAQVARPAETVMICDHAAFDWGVSLGQLYYPAPRHLREPPRQLPDGRTVPQGILNVALADGHVQGMTHEQFWAIRPGYVANHRVYWDFYVHFWPYE